jgi:hypothetical protein
MEGEYIFLGSNFWEVKSVNAIESYLIDEKLLIACMVETSTRQNQC